jgi:hypothetical protein
MVNYSRIGGTVLQRLTIPVLSSEQVRNAAALIADGWNVHEENKQGCQKLK